MGLMLATDEMVADLTSKVRSRIQAGAPVWESSPSDLPAWLAAEVGQAPVRSLFQSQYAMLAILEDGTRVLRRKPRA